MPALALAIWTVLIWIGRVRNIVAADGAALELLVPLLLVVLGIATLVRRQVAPLLAAVTVVVWVIRVPLVLVHHHAAAFVVVHMILAAVSLGLAALTLQRTRRPARV